MTIMPTTATTASDVLFKAQAISPEAAAAEGALDQVRSNRDSFQLRLQDTERLLGQSYFKRTAATNMTAMRAELWNQKRQTVIKTGPFTFCAAMIGGLIAAPHLGLGAAGALLIGAGAWVGYLKVMQHVVIPFRADRAVQKALHSERDQLAAALPSLNQAVQQAEKDLANARQIGVAKLEQHRPVAQVSVDEAAVTLGGVRIPVRKPRRGSALTPQR